MSKLYIVSNRIIGKLLLLSLIFLVLFAGVQNVKAGTPCPVSLDQTTFPFDFNGTITITSSVDCFQASVAYIIATYPKGKDSNPDLYANYAIAKSNKGTNPRDKRTIPVDIDFARGALGKNNPGDWVVKVCNANVLSGCGNPDNVLAKTTITVTAESVKPPPPPPPNLPQIDITTQTQCTFQSGSDVAINRITNIQPKTNYRWWWDGDWGTKSYSVVTDTSGSDISITIPGKETAFTDNTTVKKFCIDIEGIAPGRGCLQNSITLQFQNKNPQGNTSCDLTTRGPSEACTPDIIQKCKESKPVPLTCQLGQCIQTAAAGGKPTPGCTDDKDHPAIATAIGCIHTNPAEFVKDFMTFIIGISGGLAFLMMLMGAFQILTSAGNPETLNAGRERLTSAVIGLLMVIFAVLLLQIIGVDILNLPGFK